MSLPDVVRDRDGDYWLRAPGRDEYFMVDPAELLANDEARAPLDTVRKYGPLQQAEWVEVPNV